MTRLKEEDIEQVMERMGAYDQELVQKTGHALAEIAAHAVGLKNLDWPSLGECAVLPMSCGEGVIEGFSQTVAGILSYLGFSVFIPERTDASGFAETIERGAQVVFMADEERFVAVHLRQGLLSDNSKATGKGFAAALDLMAGGLRDRSVLLLGAGPVGHSAAFGLLNYGGELHVFDKKYEASTLLAQNCLATFGRTIVVESDLDQALRTHHLILDACPEPAFIYKRHLHSDTLIVAPGFPLGVHPEALDYVSQRLIHDPLQIGVATMAYELLKRITQSARGGKDGI